MLVFVIIDSLQVPASRTQAGSKSSSDGAATPAPSSSARGGPAAPPARSSILSMNQVSYVPGPDGRLELKMERYLDTFPFEYYVVVRDVEALPDVLAATLRQFAEKISEQ